MTRTPCSTARGSRWTIAGAAAGRLAAVRLQYEGRSALHERLVQDATRQQIIANIRGRAADLGEDIWIEKIKFHTRSLLDVESLRQGQDLIGDLLRDLKSLGEDPARLAALAELLRPLRLKAGAELAAERDGAEGIDLDDPVRLAGWLRDAEELLLCQLVEEPS